MAKRFNAAVSETVMPRFKSERPNDRDSSNGQDGSLIRSRRLFDSTIADCIRVAQRIERTPPKRETAGSNPAANMGEEIMIRVCSLCHENVPCIQRRDASWACGPCLKEEWERTKRKLVYKSELATSARNRFGKATAKSQKLA